MTLLIPLLVFVLVTLIVVSVSWLLFRPASATTVRLREMGGATAAQPVMSPAAELVERVAAPINRLLPAKPDEMRTLQRKLVYAGYYSPQAPYLYRALQFLSLVIFPGLTFLGLLLSDRPLSKSYHYLLFATLIGYLLPRKALDYLIDERQLRMRWGLADALDLLTVTIEAGMEFNSAIVRVAEELKDAHPDLCKEFELFNLEIRVGRSRAQALRNLAARTGVDDIRVFCTMLIQADRFGTSVGRAIRVYAHSLRVKRRQRAEQTAQKAAVKLLLPLAVFLFPTLFIVVLGPAFITLTDLFFKK
jgi:tight adherence protein C